MSGDHVQATGGLSAEYEKYSRQKCFVAYSKSAPWSPDLLDACDEVLARPEFNLEPDYADKYFDSDVPLRQKALELIANARYGIYDLSWWRDEQGRWHQPRNVYIEFGMSIALNRPTLLLRHTSNNDLELPEYLQGIRGQILEFGGKATLKRELQKSLPQWLDSAPYRDWWSHYCIPGNRQQCEYREAHPRARQRGQEALWCHVSDGPDPDRDDFRALIEEVLGRYSNVAFTHLDALPRAKGYDFLLCSHCQTVRSTPFAIYRITPHTPAETFIAIGMSLALELQFDYKIPRMLLTERESDLPSLLKGFEVVEAASDRERKDRLLKFIPNVLQKVRETAWKPRPLPFTEPLRPLEPEPEEAADDAAAEIQRLMESGLEYERQLRFDQAAETYRQAADRDPANAAARLALGQNLLRVGMFAEAEVALEAALALTPQDANTQVALGQACLKLKKIDRAGTLFDQALDQNMGDTRAWLGLAEAFEADGRLREAVTACERAQQTFPDDISLAKLNEVKRRLNKSVVRTPSGVPAIPVLGNLNKVRIYDLARSLKMESKRLIEDVRREGVDVSVPSNTISIELAEKIRDKYFPGKEAPVKRAIRVVKKAKHAEPARVRWRANDARAEQTQAAAPPPPSPPPAQPPQDAKAPVKVPGAVRLVRRKDD